MNEAVPDLVVLSHLRWSFVFQRPQHLMTRFANDRRVFFVEEPVFDTEKPSVDVHQANGNVWVVVPHLPEGLEEAVVFGAQRQLLDTVFSAHDISRYILWYYTPMMLPFTRHLSPVATVFDCMDELSAFKGAPAALLRREAELFRVADVAFTGGVSLFEAKRDRHPNIHAFPSSVDVNHFSQARKGQADPLDQAAIPHPRLGFFGVIDERMDLALLEGVAQARPDWQLVILGPVVKISTDALPRLPNIHYLGSKKYTELPGYLSGWDVALIPFALNESTHFISPTKTPEYLAAGKPVVSTSIRDVVRPYGESKLVRIADTPEALIAAAEASMAEDKAEWLSQVDAFLRTTSWEVTFARMKKLVDAVWKQRARPPQHAAYAAS